MSSRYLAPHFSLGEMIHSRTAAMRGIDNDPGPDELENLYRLAGALETIRESAAKGRAILVTSGYRCRELNSAIGGVHGSNHTAGRAADFHCPRMKLDDLFDRIRRQGGSDAGEPPELVWDELIREPSWIHYSVPADIAAPKMRVRRAVRRANGKMDYLSVEALTA